MAVSEENAKRLFYQKEIFGIENMFKFRTGGSCLTMDILEVGLRFFSNIFIASLDFNCIDFEINNSVEKDVIKNHYEYY